MAVDVEYTSMIEIKQRQKRIEMIRFLNFLAKEGMIFHGLSNRK
jgi:hypothetical protein